MRTVVVNDKIQRGYRYKLTEPVGENFDKGFQPGLTPKEMLQLGVFGGRYMRDCKKEFPKEWFAKAKFYPLGLPGHDAKLNYFKIDASQPICLAEENKGRLFCTGPTIPGDYNVC